MAGVITTLDQVAALQKRSVRDLIDMIDPRDAPVIKRLGLNGESKFRLLDFPRTKYEWFEDSMPIRSTTINDAGGISNADTEVILTNGALFKAGDVLRIGTEHVIVSSVATNTATILRGQGGTTAAAHADTVAVEKIGVARFENSDYAIGYTTSPTNPYNHTQIFDEAIAVSGSEAVDKKYGIADTMAYHMAKVLSDGKRAGTLPILLEKTFYYGRRDAGDASNPRTMGGFNEFVTDSDHVINKAGASLDLVDITSLMQTISMAGGRPDTIYVNAFAKSRISEFFKGTITTTRSEKMGGAVIDSIQTEFGVLDVVFDWLCPADELYIVDETKMGFVEYRPFQIIDVPVSVDGTVKRVLGEYGFVLLSPASHGRIYGFSTAN